MCSLGSFQHRAVSMRAAGRRPTCGELLPGMQLKHQVRLSSLSSSTLKRRFHALNAASTPQVSTADFTKMMFDRVDQQTATQQAGGAGGSTTYQAFLAADRAWSALRNMPTGSAAGPAPEFVRNSSSSYSGSASTMSSPVFDVCVCGGTLGIFLAAALAAKGWKVAVVERGVVAGRRQEWNISRKELLELQELGLLSATDVEEVIAMEFNPVRVGFHGAQDVWTRDVLNLGVRPDLLIAKMVNKFETFGGKIFDRVNLESVEVAADEVQLKISSSSTAASSSSSSEAASRTSQGVPTIRCRLLLDCMGHASPIVRQLRWGRKPDGVCLVVGGCARGVDPERNTTADIIYTDADLQPAGAASSSSSSSSSSSGSSATGEPLQYFWEAFPAADGILDQASSSSSSSVSSSNSSSGSDSSSPDGASTPPSSSSDALRSNARTVYMFTYCDAQSWRPSLAELMSDYWHLMPQYQGMANGLEGLEFTRLLFGFFPTYRDSPIQPGFDRVLQVGDASGIQSPLSFGGFGALTRHLPRLLSALDEALTADALQQSDLKLVNSYNPGLSSAWMLQKAMTAARAPSKSADPQLINKMLGGNFAAMESLGEPVMKPFLQDVIQFAPLLRTMGAQIMADPLFVGSLLAHVGPLPLADWMLHVTALGLYTGLDVAAAPAVAAFSRTLPAKSRYVVHRWLDAWKYGSGRDFKL